MKPQISALPMQALPQSYHQLPSSQWEVHYWMVIWGPPSTLPWGNSPGHLQQFLSPLPIPFPSFSQASSLEDDLELDSQINSN